MDPLTFARALEYFGTFLGGLDQKQLFDIHLLVAGELQARQDREVMARQITNAIEAKLAQV